MWRKKTPRNELGKLSSARGRAAYAVGNKEPILHSVVCTFLGVIGVPVNQREESSLKHSACSNKKSERKHCF